MRLGRTVVVVCLLAAVACGRGEKKSPEEISKTLDERIKPQLSSCMGVGQINHLLATITGLLPTALGLEKAAASNRPLALAVVGGLASSTLLSLFLVPALFTLLARRPGPHTAASVSSVAHSEAHG